MSDDVMSRPIGTVWSPLRPPGEGRAANAIHIRIIWSPKICCVYIILRWHLTQDPICIHILLRKSRAALPGELKVVITLTNRYCPSQRIRGTCYISFHFISFHFISYIVYWIKWQRVRPNTFEITLWCVMSATETKQCVFLHHIMNFDRCDITNNLFILK